MKPATTVVAGEEDVVEEEVPVEAVVDGENLEAEGAVEEEAGAADTTRMPMPPTRQKETIWRTCH